jgi:glycosyltransferase involved in cell wall biosynthesis
MPTKQAPLVSAVMPTYNRPEFVRHAFGQFITQTYPCKELVIIDDGEIPIPQSIAKHPWVKYIRLGERLSLGEKHNIGTLQAQGEYIIHWDDDDWFNHHRIGVQMESLMLGEADFSGILTQYILSVPDCSFVAWRRGYPKGARVVRYQGHDGTMAFHRKWFDRGIRYPDLLVAQKLEFIHLAMDAGAKVVPLPNRGMFVYIRHATNTWKFPRFWLADVKTPTFFPQSSLEFYRGSVHV